MSLAVNLYADTITFKSGKKIEGTVKTITNNTITVDLYGVTEMTYDLSDIQDINGKAVGLKPEENTEAVPETSAPPVQAVETAPTPSNEIFRGVKAPAMESAESVPTTTEPKEEIPEFDFGKTSKTPSPEETKTILAGLMAFLGILIVLCLIIYIYSAVCLQIIAKKTGTQYGWMAWVPIANIFLMCNIGRVSLKWLIPLLLIFVPFISILGSLYSAFLSVFLWYNIAIARGKQGWIGILIIIPVLGAFIVPGYLAFSKEEGAVPVPNIGGGQPADQLGTTPTDYKPPVE